MRLAVSSVQNYPLSGRKVSLIASLAISASALLAGSIEVRLTQHIAQALESRIPRADLNGHPTPAGIIILGGATSRVKAALQLAQRFPDARIILSGPGEREIAFATAHNRQPGRLIIDRRALNTFENALYSREIVGSGANGRWIVVTSAVHMPRAVASFEAAGLPVLPWPVYDTTIRSRSSRVWHEVLGLAGYWLLGRTRTLFPTSG